MKTSILFRTFEASAASFPFDQTQSTGLFQVGNVPNIVRMIHFLSKQQPFEIRVLLLNRVQDYRYYLQDTEVLFFDNLQEATAGVDRLVVLDSDRYFTIEMLEEVLTLSSNTLYVQTKSEQFKSIHGMGVKVNNARIEKVVGHGRDHYVDYLCAGAMVLNREILQLVETTPLGMDEISTGGMPYQALYLENVVQQAIKKNILINYHLVEESVLDISYPWNLLQANQQETKNLFESDYDSTQVDASCVVKGQLVLGPNSRIEHHCILKGNVRIGANTVISSGVIIEGDVIIGDDCQIENYAYISKNTVIGDGVKIGFHAEVGGVIMDHAAIVHQSEVHGVIGKRVDIGAGTLVGTLRFDDQHTNIRVKGRNMSNQSTSVAFIGDYSRTGIGNIILPGVRVGCYCSIGPGVILESDVDHEHLVLVKQEKEYRSWSPAKYGWKK